MAQAMVNFRMDAELKRAMEETCRQMGIHDVRGEGDAGSPHPV